MSSSTTDRRLGVVGGTAIKAPVAAATTANITLSANQTIDGYATATGDRILVKNQTSGVDNGIYVADSGTWTRDIDCDGSNDLVYGTLVKVNGGSTNAGFWYLSTTGTIIVGTTSQTWASASVGLAIVSAYMQTILSAADATTAFGLLAAAGISLTGDITPTILAASTDNWAPTGFSTASRVRVSSSLAVNLTGIAGGADGRMICLDNVGAFSITLKDDATSTAANRFQLNGDYTLNADSSVVLVYDATSSRWRLYGQQGTSTISTSVSFNRLLNDVGLSVTMAASAATIALKGADGNDPSASNTVVIGLRDGTTAGKVNQRSVTAAVSTVISSGSTGGTVSATPSRIWIAAIDVGGTVELAWYQSVSGNTIKGFDESLTISTTAEGGAGAADSAQIWYSTTARANVAFTIIGYFDSTQATAGTWATATTNIVINPVGRPGTVLQAPSNTTGAVASGATAIPFDDTIPQITEGTLFMTQAIVPIAAANRLEIRAELNLANAATTSGIMALFQDATANALATTGAQFTVNTPQKFPLTWNMNAGATVSTSFTVRAGNSPGNTTTCNGSAAARLFGATMDSTLTVKEIMS